MVYSMENPNFKWMTTRGTPNGLGNHHFLPVLQPPAFHRAVLLRAEFWLVEIGRSALVVNREATASTSTWWLERRLRCLATFRSVLGNVGQWKKHEMWTMVHSRASRYHSLVIFIQSIALKIHFCKEIC